MPKNNSEAVKFLLAGNEFFDKNECCEALLAYNHSLCLAEPGTQVAALCYGKRSVVYFHLKEYELSLANIESARQQYPIDGIGKLDELKTECNKLIKTHRHEPDEDPMNFFKISYPAN